MKPLLVTLKKEYIHFRSKSGERVSLAADVWHPRKQQKDRVVLFIPGYGSVRNGEKALAIGEAFTKAGFTFVAFEPRGHGESSGTIDGITVDRHLEDLAQAVKFTKKLALPIVGIGSSLGALAMAGFAARNRRAFCCFVGVGAAFGFFERWSRVAKNQRPPGLTDEAIASGKTVANEILAPKFTIPALLWHGMLDDAVDWKHAADFAARAKGSVELRLFNSGGHRLTEYKHQIAEESLQWSLQFLGAPPARDPKRRK
ncbi:MAG: alpha/beta hydrolase [Planctomycetota bacterium]